MTDPVPAQLPTLAERQEVLRERLQQKRDVMVECRYQYTHINVDLPYLDALLAALTSEPVRPTPVGDIGGYGPTTEPIAKPQADPVRPTPPTREALSEGTVLTIRDRYTNNISGGGTRAYVTALCDSHEVLRADVTRLTAELARMDELANDRGTEVIRLEQRLEKLKHLLCSECTRVTENLR